jgi:hypothetical protein
MMVLLFIVSLIVTAGFFFYIGFNFGVGLIADAVIATLGPTQASQVAHFLKKKEDTDAR